MTNNSKLTLAASFLIVTVFLWLATIAINKAHQSVKITLPTESTAPAELLPGGNTAFQKSLLLNCDELPVSSQVMSVPCTIHGFSRGKQWLEFQPADSTIERIAIYDKESEEGGHGGHISLGITGKKIKHDQDLKLAVRFNLGETPFLSETSTDIDFVGEKTVVLRNGEEVRINLLAPIIPKDDPRLIKLLAKYIKPRHYNDGDYEFTNIPEAEEEIVKVFFSDDSKMKSPEKEKLLDFENKLNSFSQKE